jgi:hypothetical protein
MLERQEYYKALVENNYDFLMTSITNKGSYPLDELMSFILSILLLDSSHHKQLSNYEDLITSVQRVLQPLIKSVESPNSCL